VRGPSGGEAPLDDPVEDGEGGPADGLVGFVAADEAAELVGGDDLVLSEVAGGEGRLPRARRPDEEDEGRIG